MSEPAPTGDTESPRVKVDARPTKHFFVEMLVRDVDLLDAVVDLVDNSVDGARRLRGREGNYTGLRVEVEFSRESFRITDNCGGMSLAIARGYAFRFGREGDDDRGEDPTGSIGQFGVGMKRTLFKLGWYFAVESRTTTEAFLLEQDVRAWRDSPEWEFEMLTDADSRRPEQDTGTTITVTQLRTSSADDLADRIWAARLQADIRAKHRRAIDGGMRITVDGQPLEPLSLGLHESAELRPAVREEQFEDAQVQLRLIVGVGSYTPIDAGWYVFLNDRLVVGPDRTALTVWEGRGSKVRGGGVRYHDQFARFRGFAMLDADVSRLLPWTSTKTGVDVDSAVWRRTRQLMRDMTRPVIDFLNQLDREKTYLAGDARAGLSGVDDDEAMAGLVVAERIDANPVVDINRITGATSFQHPEVALAKLPPQQAWVRFRVPTVDLTAATSLAEEQAGLDSPKPGDVGLYAFDYFLRYAEDS